MKEYVLGKTKEEVIKFLPERSIKKIQVGQHQLAGLRVGDQVYVFQAFCPHKGASLLEANINGAGEIICPLHQYRFDLKTGNVKAGYCEDLTVYMTRLDEDGLKITIP
ncbi:Rieske (2Fe-2S) protein [Algoriphagus lacus]|uniref:Rieske (2Fe-2S) protein n=1 Tax=Algoriphagus lacus TaxID=2056311 RepID=A0A418PWW2_9BACT|nr:Rieske 2Fe-2S domain-containing protein [Algoriphagus lacus]RIW18559.1 Rieske (2Fe-2S) protein [Algoriphagus lacus]